ncbi:MAG TPA: HIT domain-containing protein [bacterium]|nr:HIT domain-containing protein [bacterium]
MRKDKGCLFCRILAEKQDTRNYILKRTSSSFAILNRYPYSNGHVMIVPLRHVDSVHALKDREKLDWINLYEEVRLAMKKALKPHGFNVGMNLGRVGGAGVPHHMHLHVVPRWKGDVNFMPSLAETKVISESLESVYLSLHRRLKPKRRQPKRK